MENGLCQDPPNWILHKVRNYVYVHVVRASGQRLEQDTRPQGADYYVIGQDKILYYLSIIYCILHRTNPRHQQVHCHSSSLVSLKRRILSV